MASRRISFLSIGTLLIGLLSSALGSAGPLPIPVNQRLSEASGVTWLHLNGHPMSRRYTFTPGPDRYCQFEAKKVHCNARPCEGEDLLQLKISFYDPAMNEDKGVLDQYIEFAWKDVEQENPFEPRSPWTSVSSGGKYTTDVSYLPEENATLLFQQDKFMFYTYTWVKIVTNETHDKIKSLHLSYDFNQENAEEDRWTVLNCNAKP